MELACALESLSLEEQVSRFKALDLVAVQSLAACICDIKTRNGIIMRIRELRYGLDDSQIL